MKLFVYGSLLRGEENHGVMEGARLVAEARTAARYTLVDLGPYPALVEGGETAVVGELYEVTGELVATLDEFEGAPEHYQRVQVELEGAASRVETSEPVHAYVWPAQRARSLPVVVSGDWRSRRR